MHSTLRVLLLVLLSACSLSAMAERRTFVRAGLNFPISFAEQGYKESRIGLTLALEHRFGTSSWEAGLQVSNEGYTKVIFGDFYFGETYLGTGNMPLEYISTSFLPYANYHLYETRKFSAYVGAGAGLSLDNDEVDKHIVLVPRCGIRMFRRFDLNFQYYISPWPNSRGILTLSYRI